MFGAGVGTSWRCWPTCHRNRHGCSRADRANFGRAENCQGAGLGRAFVESSTTAPGGVHLWPFVLNLDVRESLTELATATSTGSSGSRNAASTAPPSTRRAGGEAGASGSSKASSRSASLPRAAPPCQADRASTRACVIGKAESPCFQRTGPTWLCTMSHSLSLMNKSIAEPCAMTGASWFFARRVTPSCRRVGSCGHEWTPGGGSNLRRRLDEQPRARHIFGAAPSLAVEVVQTEARVTMQTVARSALHWCRT